MKRRAFVQRVWRESLNQVIFSYSSSILSVPIATYYYISFCIFPVRKHFEIEADPITIVLEEDGTELVDDDYLLTLDPNTKLMVLKNGEIWRQQVAFIDETDRSGGVYTVPDPINVVEMLFKNPASIALLSEEELEVVAEADNLKSEQFRGFSSADLMFVQNACADQLEKKQRLKNALDYIDLIKRASEQAE